MNPIALILIPVVAILLGGTIQVARPLPPAQIASASGSQKLPGKFAVTFPKQGQAAVGEASLGLAAATDGQEPVAIASLTKMMTAYLLLKAKPLGPGQDGPVTTVTAADVQVYEKDKKAGDSVAKVAVGEKLTEREMLEALLLPSADNVAEMIANQIGGSEAGFVKQMNDAAKSLGMTQTTYADAAGVNPATVSTATDQLRIAQEAMKDRAFREVVAMAQATLPTAGTVYNVNFMIGKNGISGVKTGSTLAAGSCFVGSYPVTIDGKPRVILGAVLGQVSLHEALTFDAGMLHAVASQFKRYPVPTPAGGFAKLTTPWGADTPLVPAKPIEVFGFPGMPVTYEAKLTQDAAPIAAGQPIATMTFNGGGASDAVPLNAQRAVEKPGLFWRLHR